MKTFFKNLILILFFGVSTFLISLIMLSCVFHFSEPKERDYVIDSNNKTFHYYSCDNVAAVDELNVYSYFGSRDTLLDKGFKPCDKCKP